MASYTKRGDKWQVRLTLQGKYACKTFQTKGQARAWVADVEAQIHQGIAPVKSKNTLVDAFDRYIKDVSPTKRGARWEIIRLNAWKGLPFAHIKIADITTSTLANWRDARLKEVMSSTVNRELNLLSSVFEYARTEWKWVRANPVHDLKRPFNPPHRERLISQDETQQICEALGFNGEVLTKQQITAIALLFALETAMRREEITSLEWDRVHIGKKHVSLSMTKNGDSRKVPLSKKAIELLVLAKAHPKPFDVDKDVLTTLFRKACKRSGIEGVNFHDSRHTAITRLAKVLQPFDLARMAGHRDLKATLRYYHVSASDLAEKLDKT